MCCYDILFRCCLQVASRVLVCCQHVVYDLHDVCVLIICCLYDAYMLFVRCSYVVQLLFTYGLYIVYIYIHVYMYSSMICYRYAKDCVVSLFSNMLLICCKLIYFYMSLCVFICLVCFVFLRTTPVSPMEAQLQATQKMILRKPSTTKRPEVWKVAFFPRETTTYHNIIQKKEWFHVSEIHILA